MYWVRICIFNLCTPQYTYHKVYKSDLFYLFSGERLRDRDTEISLPCAGLLTKSLSQPEARNSVQVFHMTGGEQVSRSVHWQETGNGSWTGTQTQVIINGMWESWPLCWAKLTFYSIFHMDLFERQSDKEKVFVCMCVWQRERGREIEREVLQLLVHSPSDCKSWSGVRSKPGDRNCIGISHLDDRNSCTWVLACCFPSALAGGWLEEECPGLETAVASPTVL